MNTIDSLHARVAELVAERNFHQDRAEHLLEELAESRRQVDAMRPVVEAADLYQRIYTDPAFNPETASNADWHAEGNALRMLRGEVCAYRAQQDKCHCDLHHKAAGDGCAVCNPEMAAEIERENAQQKEAGGASSCVWSEDDAGVFEMACGSAWEFMNGGPVENECRYCPKCGKPIKANYYRDIDTEEADNA